MLSLEHLSSNKKAHFYFPSTVYFLYFYLPLLWFPTKKKSSSSNSHPFNSVTEHPPKIRRRKWASSFGKGPGQGIKPLNVGREGEERRGVVTGLSWDFSQNDHFSQKGGFVSNLVLTSRAFAWCWSDPLAGGGRLGGGSLGSLEQNCNPNYCFK